MSNNSNRRPKSISFKPPRPSTAITSTNVISFNNGHNTHNSTIATSSNATVRPTNTASSSSSSISSSLTPSSSSSPNNTKKDYRRSKKINEFKLKKELPTTTTTNVTTPITNTTTSSSSTSSPSSIINDEFLNNQIEELNFLYLIYVPNKYLIKNNKKSIKNLIIHLPKLIPSQNQLNLIIHVFLSSIMVKFINSWYLTKLNTSNLEFLKGLYDGLIIEFIKDLISRISKINILDLSNQLINILNDHLSNLIESSDYSRPFPYKFQNEYFELCDNENNLKYDINKEKNINDLNIDYLSNSHILFQNDPVNYYRILIKQILLVTFQEEEEEEEDNDNIELNPFSSKISSDLIILIVGDLVIGNIVDKLSSLDFIFNKMNDILDLLLIENEPVPIVPVDKNKPISQRVRDWIYGTYTNLTKLIVLYHGKIKNTPLNESTINDEFNVFESSVFSLIETIFNFLKRKPILFNMIKSLKTLVQLNTKLTSSINKIITRYLENKINENITEERLSKIINDLRLGLFYNDNSNQPQEDKPNVTMDELIEKFIKLNKKLSSIIDISYKDETEQDLRNSIKLVLIIFQDDGEYLNKGMNKLLIIRLLDCIVGNLYDI